jgi:hypothetical protein
MLVPARTLVKKSSLVCCRDLAETPRDLLLVSLRGDHRVFSRHEGSIRPIWASRCSRSGSGHAHGGSAGNGN